MNRGKTPLGGVFLFPKDLRYRDLVTMRASEHRGTLELAFQAEVFHE
ncbi:MAG: hypothetical protein ACXVAC_09035 [Vulcanimicrobiaceae bacterium]